MNKIKDFFYNKNDIIIVLIILIAAAFIIYWRIDSIMAYPEKLAEKTAQQQETETTSQEDSSSASSTSQEETTAASAATTGANVSITITDSDSSISVATKLYEAGLISSDTEFESYISNMGKSSSIKSGTFQIPKGSSNEEILKIIAN
ncbi:MAG: hypothetical protein ACLSAO_07650 [Anaerovoracaceae bacterium]